MLLFLKPCWILCINNTFIGKIHWNTNNIQWTQINPKKATTTKTKQSPTPNPPKIKNKKCMARNLNDKSEWPPLSLCLENKFIIQSRSYHVIWISILYFPLCSYMLDENFLYFSFCNDRSFHNTTNTKCTHWP